MIDTNKDRQEQAVVAFTIVTIVFLPLSFVSSFLGMNTVDIRESNKGEYLFWSSAVPLTTVILITALHWTGEVNFFQLSRRVAQWVARGFRRDPSDDDLDSASQPPLDAAPIYSPPPPVTVPQNMAPALLPRPSSHAQYHVTKGPLWEQDMKKIVAEAFMDGPKLGETRHHRDVQISSKEQAAALMFKRGVRRKRLEHGKRAERASLETLTEDSQDSGR